ncbi:MAG: 1-acyl-sn-glycerol-3-phosphate acyltransferase [Eubacteriales bacterium]
MGKFAKVLDKMIREGISKEEYEKFYFETRNRDEKSFLSSLSLRTRQKLHKTLLSVLKIKNRLEGFRCEVINDERSNMQDRPIIFVPSHVGKFDIELISEAIKEHYYLLTYDYENIKGTLDALFLDLNGVFYFLKSNKTDRKRVKDNMVTHLKKGGNILYFIEGEWNFTPNLMVLPVYWGIVDIARESNAVILPIGVCQYEKTFLVNIGTYFDMKEYGDSQEEKTRVITDLRDILATLVWEIYETKKCKRSEITSDYWDTYVDERLGEWSNITMDMINENIYKPKGIVTWEEVFEPIRKSHNRKG